MKGDLQRGNMTARRSLTVFVSSVTEEFKNYREELTKYLNGHEFKVLCQESLVDNGLLTLLMLDDNIRKCDVVLHLVGERTGKEDGSSIPLEFDRRKLLERYPKLLGEFGLAVEEAADLSFTQWEVVLALHHQRFRKDRDLPVFVAQGVNAPPFQAVSDSNVATAQRAAQAQHLERLKRWQKFKHIKFTNAFELQRGVESELRSLYLAHRERQMLSKWSQRLFVSAMASVVVLGTMMSIPACRKRVLSLAGLEVAGLAVKPRESRLLRLGQTRNESIKPSEFITPLELKPQHPKGIDARVISRTSADAWQSTLDVGAESLIAEYSDPQAVVTKLPDVFECTMERKPGDLAAGSMILVVYCHHPSLGARTYLLFPDYLDRRQDQVSARFSLGKEQLRIDEVAEARAEPCNLYFQAIVYYGTGASSAANVRIEFPKEP